MAVEYVKGVDGHVALCRASRGELDEQQSTMPEKTQVSAVPLV
jgi:hypothetical protein